MWVADLSGLHVGCSGLVSRGVNGCYAVWGGNSVLHCRWVISNSHRPSPWSSQFDRERFLYPSFKLSVFSGQDAFITFHSKEGFSFQM